MDSLNFKISHPANTMNCQLVSILNMFSTLCYSLDPCMNGEEEVAVVSSGNPGKTAVIEETGKPAVNEPLIPIVEKILPSLILIAEKWNCDETFMELF
jgi:hypothetical protein